jgi:hypothetical protein
VINVTEPTIAIEELRELADQNTTILNETAFFNENKRTICL